MRRLGSVIAALLAAGVLASAGIVAPRRRHVAPAVPKVVFIVGPAGAATIGYRARGTRRSGRRAASTRPT